MQEEDKHLKIPLRLLRRFCPDHLYEEIEGDLIQKFNRDLNPSDRSNRSDGYWRRRAKRRLIWNAVRFFRPGILLRNKFQLNLIRMMLLTNHFKMAFRQIRKDKIFSAVNIFGLSVSMAVCLLIFQYSYFELNHDKNYPNAADIYRVATLTYEGDQIRYHSARSLPVLAPVLEEKIPEIARAGRLFATGWFDCSLAYDRKGETIIFNENKLYYADQGFLDLFHTSVLQGDQTIALAHPFSAVLSTSSVKKYFGNENALGKVLRLRGSGDNHEYTVTGVIPDPAPDSHIDAEILLSASSLEAEGKSGFQDAYTYVQLSPTAEPARLTGKLQPIANELSPSNSKSKNELILQPISDIHLYSSLQDEIKPSGNAKAIYFLLLVAVVVLVIAWINYINLTISRSVSRAKEVSIRKVTGATRIQIAFQFLTETFIFNLIGLTSAIALVYFVAPHFYEFVGLTIPSNPFLAWKGDGFTYIILFSFLGCVILIGFFPAQFISSLNPVKALKGKRMMDTNRFSFRKATVVFQFTCAIVLAIAVITFNQQFDFMRKQDLGFDIKNSLVLKSPSNTDSTYLQQLSGFKDQLKSLAIVHSISTSMGVPGKAIGWTGEIKKEGDESTKDFIINVVDSDFRDTYHIKLLAGRDFEPNDFPGKHFGDKLESVMLNRIATEKLGYKKPDDSIGELIYWGTNKCLVVGVVEDFHHESVKKSIQPMLLAAHMGPSMTVRLTNGADKNLKLTLTQIQKAWNQYFPNNPFDYFFLEDMYDEQYASDEQVAKLFNFFCLLALIISCLGLFALSLFSVSQRTKEISIRKVLGASIGHLIQLLTSEYLLLISAASAIALPLSYWGIGQWLEGFALRIQINIWLFVIPIVLILVIALLTVGSQTLKVVIKNPVDNLKDE